MQLLALLALLLFVGGGARPSPNSRAEEGTAKLQLLFDPGLLHVSFSDEYGEKPFPPPLPPDMENPYQPHLQDEYD